MKGCAEEYHHTAKGVLYLIHGTEHQSKAMESSARICKLVVNFKKSRMVQMMQSRHAK